MLPRISRSTALLTLLATLSADGANVGDTYVLTPLPASPGSPEGVLVIGHTVFVSTPARFGTAGQGPSVVYAFDVRTGAALAQYTIVGENLDLEHGLSGMAQDQAGRVYVLSTQLGIVRIDPASGAQTIYASAFPSAGPPALPNDLAFDDAGNAYVTDSLQARIYRVPAGGGTPQVWFSDDRLVAPFGPNGIRLDPTHQKVVFVVTGLGVPGAIYSLPIVAQPAAGDLQLIHSYGPFEAPDDLAFGSSGKLYITLAGTSEVSVIAPDGSEQRLHDPLFDGPANIALDNRTGSLILANHAAFSQNPADFALLETYVADHDEPLAVPALP